MPGLNWEPMRSRSTPNHRAAVLRRFSASGLSLAAFCQREGLAYHSVLAWRRAQRLADAGVAGTASQFLDVECAADVSLARQQITDDSPFVPTVTPIIPQAYQQMLIAELALPGGVCLRVFSGSAATNSCAQ